MIPSFNEIFVIYLGSMDSIQYWSSWNTEKGSTLLGRVAAIAAVLCRTSASTNSLPVPALGRALTCAQCASHFLEI